MPSRAPAAGLQPYAIEGFGGLNLRDDPDEVGVRGAIDMQNVELDRNGRIRQRDGLTKVFTLPDINAQPVKRMLPFYEKNELMVSITGSTKKVYALSSSWSVTASQALTSANGGDMVAFGSASNELVYIADWGTALRKFDGTTFSTVAGTVPLPMWLAVQKPDNRLVAGYTGNTVAEKSKVWFSDPGAPETFQTNNYVLLSPNDGGYITGLVTWRDQLFAFKQDRFFTFYGNSTDNSGNPVFNYRTVETGLGAAYGQSVVAGREGVYFVNQSGVWLTTGGPPVKISGALDPLFEGYQPPWLTGATTIETAGSSPGAMHRLGYALGRLYAHLRASDGSIYTFVYDPETKQWVVWASDIAYTVEYAPNGAGTAKKVFMAATGFASPFTNRIFYLDPTTTTDDGASFTGYYQPGFFDLDQPGMEKTIRQTELVGQGVVNLEWYRDMATTALSHGTQDNVTLGTAPATARGLHRNAMYGELLSFRLTGTLSGGWSVNRVVPMIQSTRGPGAM